MIEGRGRRCSPTRPVNCRECMFWGVKGEEKIGADWVEGAGGEGGEREILPEQVRCAGKVCEAEIKGTVERQIQ